MIKHITILFSILITVITSCSDHHAVKPTQINVSCDLDSIRKRGKLIAVTNFNSADYFIYKGEPMGFNYELLKSFSENTGLDLEIIPENNPVRACSMLKSGEADLLAFNLDTNTQDIQFTGSIGETRHVLVQRKPHGWRTLSTDALSKSLVRDQSGLAGKTIYVQEGSPHAEQLITQAHESGESVNIIEVPFDAEKLISSVANGEIDYTVCDENIAQVNASYFPDIDVNTPVSTNRDYAWGIRKNNSEKLLTELNHWIRVCKLNGSFSLLYAKYYRNTRSNSIVKSDLYALSTGKVSEYDDLIRRYSDNIDWDWRLLASLICQESHFNPKVESRKGAFGLMQIMPETGRNFGIDSASSPEENMRAGIRYINWLHSIFDTRIPDSRERICFILAAYNAGPGHILDAMNLAAKNGMDPLKWEGNVAFWLLKKSEPRYYNDTVVKNGYFKGKESVKFVSQIIERFEHYKNIIPQQRKNPF